MKKVFFLAVLCLVSFLTKADIVIVGKPVEIIQTNGSTYVYCKGRKGECIRVETQAPINQRNSSEFIYESKILIDNETFNVSYNKAEVIENLSDETTVVILKK